MSEIQEVKFSIVLILIAVFVSYCVGMLNGAKQKQDESVKAGVGEYFLNADNEKEFRFKKEEKK